QNRHGFSLKTGTFLRIGCRLGGCNMIVARMEADGALPRARQAKRELIAMATVAAALALSPAARAEQFTIFDVPDSAGTFPQSINADSTITGFSVDTQGIAHGFVRTSDGTIVSFSPKDPVSINKRGWTA